MAETSKSAAQTIQLRPVGKGKRGRPSLADMARRVGTRDGLLQAARDLMVTKDSVDFSLSQLAKLTGQSPALVQYHFGNKEGLLLALIELDAVKAINDMKALTALDIPADKKMRLHIAGLVSTYFKAPYANRLLHALMQNASRESAQRVSDFFLTPIATLQRNLLEQGVKDGIFRPVNAMNFYFVLLGSCDQFFSRRGALAHVFGVEDMTEEVMHSYALSLTELVMRGILIDLEKTS